jgi:hypothetical protein
MFNNLSQQLPGNIYSYDGNNDILYQLFSEKSIPFGNDKYFPDWKNGVLYVIKFNTNNDMIVKTVNMGTAIKTAKEKSPELYELLF